MTIKMDFVCKYLRNLTETYTNASLFLNGQYQARLNTNQN